MKNTENKFQRSRKGYIIIQAKVLADMISYSQDDPTKHEAGGVLLGKIYANSNNVLVTKITSPMPTDSRQRFTFYRKDPEHQKTINKLWKESDGFINYLGEWHTHPEQYPEPSLIDLRSWKNHVAHAQFEGDSLIFIIVGIRALTIFEVFKDDLSVHNLLLIK